MTTEPREFPTHAHAWADITSRQGEPHQYWEYHDRQGSLVGLVLRWNRGGEGKTFLPISLRDGRWFCRAMSEPRPLYRLPEVLHGVDRWSVVYVTEGEKAADALRALGLVATTSSGGSAAAAKTDWTPLAGASVVILPDCDPPGRKYAQEVARILQGLTPETTVRIANLSGLAAGEDVVEWIAQRDGKPANDVAHELGKLASDVVPLANPRDSSEATSKSSITTDDAVPRDNSPSCRSNVASLYSPVLLALDRCQPSTLEWLWPGRIPRGKLTLLIGDPGLGKSLVTLDIAARVTRGAAMPQVDRESLEDVRHDSSPSQPGSVVLLSAEDDVSDTICPRLAAAGADMTRVQVLQGIAYRDATSDTCHQESFSLAIHLEALAAAIRSLADCRLVVIDPLPAYMGGNDTHNNAEVRTLLAPLAELAAQTGVAILGVNHLSKSGGAPVIYRSMGSLAIAATARSVLGTVRDPDDPTRVVLTSIKSNLGNRPEGIAYRVNGSGEARLPRVDWLPDSVRMSADELLAAAAAVASSSLAIDDACRWLSDLLRDGPQPGAEIYCRGPKLGHSVRTLRRAKIRLGVISTREGFGTGATYTWQLPNEVQK